MEPETLSAVDTVLTSLGLNPKEVGEWTIVLFAWRLVAKMFSSQLQMFLEKLIRSAEASGDSRIIGVVGKVTRSFVYAMIAWPLDAIFSMKLPRGSATATVKPTTEGP